MPDLFEPSLRDARRRRRDAGRRNRRDAMRERMTAFGASVLGRGLDDDRQIGYRKASVLGQRNEDRVGITLVEQLAVLDHDGGTQLVWLLGHGIAPVDFDDLSGNERRHQGRFDLGEPTSA